MMTARILIASFDNVSKSGRAATYRWLPHSRSRRSALHTPGIVNHVVQNGLPPAYRLYATMHLGTPHLSNAI